MSEMLLLGAGASIEAGIPGAFEMTRNILNTFRSKEQEPLGHLLSFVAGGLLFEEGKSNRDPLTCGINVEALFNAVQLLADRRNLEASPFVGSWHAMIEEFDRVRPSTVDARDFVRSIYRLVSEEIRKALGRRPPYFEAQRIDSALADYTSRVSSPSSFRPSSKVGEAIARYIQETSDGWREGLSSAYPNSNYDLDRTLAKVLEDSQSRSAEGQLFQRANERMIARLKDIVWLDDPDKVKYLQPILRLVTRQRRLAIATLNYDNCIELLGQQNKVAVHTGIEEWSETGRFTPPDDGIFLLKLHGSIDWSRVESGLAGDGRMPHSVIQDVSVEEMRKEGFRPAVIFGQRNKLTAEGPFLDLLTAFRTELTKSQVLTVVGYSFSDPHVNVFISQWLNSSVENRIRIVNGESFGEQPNDYVGHLLRLRSARQDQVEIIPKYAGEGLQKLYPDD